MKKNIYMSSKAILFAALLSVMAVSCNSGGTDDSLEGKKKQLEQYQKELLQAKEAIAKLENEIREMEGEEVIVRKPVKVTTIARATYKHPVDLQGVVESDADVTISAEASGRAVRVLVTDGQQVAAGQLLVKLDDEILVNSLAELTTAYDMAKLTYEKQDRLWKQNIGSEMEYLSAKNSMERLERQMATTRSRLAQTEVRATISGKVDQVMVNEGELVGAGMPLVRVVNMSQVKVVAQVSERYLGKFAKGDVVDIDFPSIGQQVSGTIEAIGSVINPSNRTFRMVIKANGGQDWMKPNLLAKVKAYDMVVPDAIVVPTRILHEQDGNYFVYVVREQDSVLTAHKQQVQVGFSGVEQTLISSGLTGEEQIVLEGHINLSEGELVVIVD